ncbi:hypothetical protein TWF481_006888 [Arthrobotrys musiformis]|uniref:Heterokaryon incompatibility domain-containing protein n=1 Tax=Arthrobotrys musiformis TaxID=47236 RepID=A0AAV9WB79_9PEZI
MEHLLLVDTNIFTPFTFPLVGEKWDGGSFDEYPQRRQFDTTTQKFYAEGVENSPDATYAFYQTWLYLGLVTDAFYCEDPNEVFLRHDDEVGGLVLTTEKLGEVVDNWKATLNAMDLPDKVVELTRSIEALRKVDNQFREINVPNGADLIWLEGVSPVGENIRFAIALLCDALGYSISCMCGPDFDEEIEKYNSKWSRGEELPLLSYPYFRWVIGTVLHEAMDRALLCPVEKAQLANSSPAFLCYLLSLPETNRYPGQHGECNSTTCVGNNIDEETYVTKHVDDDCDCEHDGPNIEDVKKCLRDGHIPSLTLSIVDGEYRGMKVKPQKVENATIANIWRFHQAKTGLGKSLDYVALSHVWSDGLGNPKANTLPRCQLKRLAYYANYTMNDGRARGVKGNFEKAFSKKFSFAKRSGTVWEQGGNFECALWTDTLCVPLEKEYRKLAIKTMNQVYRQARFVMILDASIARHDYSTDEELMGRVVLSTWMRRVWTLQEAILGMEKLSICTRDQVIDHTDALERLRVMVNGGTRSLVNGALESVAILGDDGFQGLNGAVAIMEYRSKKLVSKIFIDEKQTEKEKQLDQEQFVLFMERLWSLIGRRATTKEEDRVLVACNIMYKDVSMVLKGGGHTGRMTALLDQLDEVPAGSIFRTGERVPIDGYRWASHGFDYSAWGRFDLANPGRVTPQGLLVRFAGYILSEKPSRPDFPLRVESAGEQEFYIVTCSYQHKTGELLSPEDWSEVIERNSNNLAIIRSERAQFTHSMPLKDGRMVPCQQIKAILVSIKEEEGGTIHCRHESFVWLSKAPGPEYESLLQTTHPTVVTEDPRPTSQQWCVG